MRQITWVKTKGRAGSGLMLWTMLAFCWNGPIRADRSVLKGGGEVKGVVVPDPDQPDVVLVQTEMIAKPLSFAKAQVVRVVREPSVLDTYFERRDTVSSNAQAQYEFGL